MPGGGRSPLFDVKTLPGWTPLSGPSSGSPQRQPTGKPAPAPLQPPPSTSGLQPAAPAAADASWVRTDEDVCRYFDAHGSTGVQFFYALRSEESAAAGKSNGSNRGGASWDAATGAGADFFLRVVPPERCAHMQQYFVLSQRAVVHVQRGSEHTDVMPLAGESGRAASAVGAF